MLRSWFFAFVFVSCICLRRAAAEEQPATPPASAQLVAEFTVKDLARSRAFYEALGFKTTHVEKTFLELQWIDGHKLFLSESKDAPAQSGKPTINIRIGVAKADEHWKKAQVLKARVITPIGDRFYGERDFLIADPDGFGLRFSSLLPKGHW
jgi:uncharacterized glyoxalase superfamily protein PhnB